MSKFLINKKFITIIDIKNLDEALYSEKIGFNSICLLDDVPLSIKNLRISSPQFEINNVKNIYNNIKIPLIIRIRIGNTQELSILNKAGIQNFLEVNTVKTEYDYNYIPKSVKNNYNSYFYSESNNLIEALKQIIEGSLIVIISSTNISNLIRKIVSIYKDILKLNNNAINFSIKNNIPLDIVSNIIENKRLPIKTIVSGIKSIDDIYILFKLEKIYLQIIDGFFIDNCFFADGKKQYLSHIIDISNKINLSRLNIH